MISSSSVINFGNNRDNIAQADTTYTSLSSGPGNNNLLGYNLNDIKGYNFINGNNNLLRYNSYQSNDIKGNNFNNDNNNLLGYNSNQSNDIKGKTVK
jgi:hypothetical protein